MTRESASQFFPGIWAWPNKGERGVNAMSGGLNSAILHYVGAWYKDPSTSYVHPVNTLQEVDLRVGVQL